MNILVVGYGAMGKRLVSKINSINKLKLVAIIDDSQTKDFDLVREKVDVVVDFSHPNNLERLLAYCTQSNTPLLIATTGYTKHQQFAIKRASKHIPILYTANTSLGVNLLNETLKQVTSVLSSDYDIEIIEKHHNKKVDAPSGTALLLADTIKENYEKEIEIHSLRMGTIVGEHSVIYASDDEVIEIKHQALSKNIFVNGALKGAQFISKRSQPGLYSMKDVLFSESKEEVKV